jgi:hypothetical protein
MDSPLIGKDVISFFAGKNSLLDAKLTSLCIRDVDGGIVLYLDFKARNGAQYQDAHLTFSGVIEFGFYHSDEFTFYNVESLKFLTTTDGAFYLSLDPDESREEISEADQDFIKAKFVEALVT